MSHTGVAKVTISLPPELLERVDGARGKEPRSTFIARTLGAALAATATHGGVPGHPSIAQPPAPRRTPEAVASLRQALREAEARKAPLCAEIIRAALG